MVKNENRYKWKIDVRKITVTIISIIILVVVMSGCGRSSNLEECETQAAVTLTGGTGKAHIESPCQIRETDGQKVAHIIWSSKYYDYMIVGDTKYLPVNTEGNSEFEIPFEEFDKPFKVVADTTAMSTSHEIEYEITLIRLDGPEEISDLETTKLEEDEENIQLAGLETDSVSMAKRDINISNSLVYIKTNTPVVATEFAVDEYEDGYVLLYVRNSGRYLIVPEGKAAPTDLAEDIQVIKQPAENIYLAASNVGDIFDALDSVGQLRFSGTRTEGWYVDGLKLAMQQEKVIYAGNYAAPDYELILSQGCSLAIENTMIGHAPKVVEQLKNNGISVFIDYSSYEKSPIGRMEWIKVYGSILGKEDEAEEIFNNQRQLYETAAAAAAKESPKVAFFYIASDGQVKVRTGSDYMAKMIEDAGGEYAFKELTGNMSTTSITMEEFYAKAVDCDILIYNSTTGSVINSIEDLIKLNPMLADIKAVKEKRVYCTKANLYQSAMALGDIMSELRAVYNGEENNLSYIEYIK